MRDNGALSERNRKRFFRFEVFGAIFVSCAAVILHFLYEWSGKEFWVTLFSAVNESVWEHLKIFSIPYVIWGFVELCCLRIPFKKFVSAKVLSLYFMLLSIPVFYYTYTGLTGKNIAAVDIASGFVFTVLAFVISYRLVTKAPCIERYYKVSLVLLVVYFFMIAYFTYVPPKSALFRDPISGEYGIPLKNNSKL